MLEWTALIASALVVGVAKAGFGSGVGIVAVPLMAVAIGAERMLGVLLPVLIVGDVFSVVHYVRLKSGRNLRLLLGGCAVGVAAGVLALDRFRGLERGEAVLGAVVGGLCVVFVVTQAALTFRRARPTTPGHLRCGLDARPATPGHLRCLVRSGCAGDARARKTVPRSCDGASPADSGETEASRGRTEAAPYRPAAWHGVLVGAVAGLASTLAHAAGPIVAMFLLPQRMDRRVFVGTSAWFYLGTNLMKLGPYVLKRQPIVTADTLGYLPYLAPVVVAGTFLGVWMNRRIPARAFSVVIYVVVLVTGLKLVAGIF